jgi:hypothetical protein
MAVQEATIKLGATAVRVEENGWLTFYRNVPDQSKWEAGPKSDLYVIERYLVGSAQQPDMRYGCSRHHAACVFNPPLGSAPFCASVMQEIMDDMTLVLAKEGIHWRVTQGQMCSVRPPTTLHAMMYL